ncbi:uncharacterized protein LOC114911105 [Tachysurus ichikawai]
MAGVRALCQAVSEGRRTDVTYSCVVRQAGAQVSAVPKAYCHPTALAVDQSPALSLSELQTAQRDDVLLGEVWKAVCHRKPASSIQSTNPKIKLLIREWVKLSVDKGILYRTVQQSDYRVKRQLVLPDQFHSRVLTSLHDETGHLGFEKSYSLIRDRDVL